MLNDNYNISVFNKPNPSFEKGTISKKLLLFIEETLFIFQKEFKGNQNTSEEKLSEHLAKTFDYYSKPLPFIFQKEVIQEQLKGHNKKVDIGVFMHYADNEPFFTLEAKRLPIPPPKSREKEYVIGIDSNKPSDGIERYKLNLHGVNLIESALIAYVQAGTFKDWHIKINKWIGQLIKKSNNLKLSWVTEDLLINTCYFEKKEMSKFISNNKKVDNGNIKLFHYFINLMS